MVSPERARSLSTECSSVWGTKEVSYLVHDAGEQPQTDTLRQAHAQISPRSNHACSTIHRIFTRLCYVSMCCKLVSLYERTHRMPGYELLALSLGRCEGDPNPGDVCARFHAPMVTEVPRVRSFVHAGPLEGPKSKETCMATSLSHGCGSREGYVGCGYQGNIQVGAEPGSGLIVERLGTALLPALPNDLSNVVGWVC